MTTTIGKLVPALKEFAADPAGVAARYGKLTGICCFCSTPLSDPRSTDMGYGPTCADHYGLPWGSTATHHHHAPQHVAVADVFATL